MEFAIESWGRQGCVLAVPAFVAPRCGGTCCVLRVACGERGATVAAPGIFQGLANLKIRGTFLVGMKTTMMIWAAALMVTQSAIGEGTTNFLFRNRFPIANDTLRCDLTPLYVWWAEQLTQRAQSGGERITNGIGSTANLTERPMAPWVHITGEIDKEDPQGWIVNATVEYAPGKGNGMKILLIHPPRKELARFAVKSNLVNNPPPPPDYSAQEEEIKAQKNRAFVANAIGDDDLEEAYMASAAQFERDLDARKKRDQSVVAERNRNLEDLGNFPSDWQMYHVDVFALNTGRQLYGLPIFDAGLSFTN
jgi:hypothetical protein